MQRVLLSVEREAGTWQVRLGDEVLLRHHCKRAAIDQACRFARNRHQATGERTGVAAPVCNGEVVVLERYEVGKATR